jgi:4-oxalocrotonate tautomerase
LHIHALRVIVRSGFKSEVWLMSLAIIKVIEGVFSADEKRRMIEQVTEAMASVEGEKLREKTYVILEEVPSGHWGDGGRTVTTADVQRMRAGP